jgi:hypothetical protein
MTNRSAVSCFAVAHDPSLRLEARGVPNARGAKVSPVQVFHTTAQTPCETTLAAAADALT